jgi:hypothetical protein
MAISLVIERLRASIPKVPEHDVARLTQGLQTIKDTRIKSFIRACDARL